MALPHALYLVSGRYLGDYVEGLDRDNLQVAVWEGSCSRALCCPQAHTPIILLLVSSLHVLALSALSSPPHPNHSCATTIHHMCGCSWPVEAAVALSIVRFMLVQWLKACGHVCFSALCLKCVLPIQLIRNQSTLDDHNNGQHVSSLLFLSASCLVRICARHLLECTWCWRRTR